MTLTDIFSFIYKVLNFQLFTVKDTTITLFSLLMFFLVIGGFLLVSRMLIRIFLAKLLTRLKIEEGTRYTFMRVTHYTVLVIGAIIAFQFIGIDLSGLIVIFGFLSVGIGFGLQNLTSNFISGLILLFERPIRVGDRVTVGDTEGDVQEINIRSTTVRSLNNISIIVPNSEFISSNVVNWSHGDPKVRIEIEVGVSYNSDLNTVLRSLEEVAKENAEVMDKPAPEVLFKEFGDSSWNLQLRAWISTHKRHPQVRSAINCAIVRKFRENGIEVPFPQRDLHVRSSINLPLVSKIDD